MEKLQVEMKKTFWISKLVMEWSGWMRFEQPYLVKDVPAQSRDFGLDDPSNPKQSSLKKILCSLRKHWLHIFKKELVLLYKTLVSPPLKYYVQIRGSFIFKINMEMENMFTRRKVEKFVWISTVKQSWVLYAHIIVKKLMQQQGEKHLKEYRH